MTRLTTRKQSGLSLVELMIAITLSLLLMAGVMQMFITSKQTYNTNNALARVQESGRFAIDFLTYDIRNAGYKGECTGAPNVLLNTGGSDYIDLYDISNALNGWDNPASGTPSWVTDRTGGDVIVIKHAANASGSTANGNTPANASTITLTGPSSIKQHSILIVSDPLGCDVFQNRADNNASTLSRGVGAGNPPGNANGTSFSHTYNNTMEILTLQSATYYIGNSDNSNRPALRRISYNTGTAVNEELVDGIQDMQITYGIADANKQVTTYETANQGGTWSKVKWESVASVRIDLLAVSAETNVVETNQVIAFNGANVTIPDRRLARTFSTTIAIRNRLP